MSVTKQLIINSIQLPMDVLGVVKGFCFYDVRTATQIESYKFNKKKMLEELLGPIEFQHSSNCDGAWASVFWKQDDCLDIEDDDMDPPDPYWDQMIAASNCLTCGNYDSCYNVDMADLPDCIKCRC